MARTLFRAPRYAAAILGSALLLWLPAVPARAQDPGLSIRVHAVSDHVASPPVAGCLSAGAVGGPVTIHVGFQLPPNANGPSFRELRIHEMAGHTPDLVHTGAFNGVAHSECGDSSSMVWGDVGWLTTGFHNGEHLITAVVEYLEFQDGLYVTRTLSGTLNVNVQNLLITNTTPANPQVIYWDGSPKQLSVSFTCGYRAAAEAKLEIFTTEQVPVRTLTRQITTADGSASFEWDGMPDGAVSPEEALPNDPYLFRFTVTTDYTSGVLDSDQDKSRFLTIAAGADPVEILSASVGSAVYKVHYELASDRPASDGRVNVFDATGEIAQDTLAGAELTPAPQSTDVTVTGTEVEYDIFLISARDDHSATDRGHRLRWALQRNQIILQVSVGLFGAEGPAALAHAWDLAQTGWWRNGRIVSRGVTPQVRYDLNPTPRGTMTPVAQPATTAGAATGYYTMHTSRWHRGDSHIWCFFGHGEGGANAGKAIIFPDKAHITDSITVTGSRASHRIANMPNGSLAKVRLVILAACESGSKATPTPNSTSLEGILRSKGVHDTSSFDRIMNTGVAAYWLEQFWTLYCGSGATVPGTEIRSAAFTAQRQTLEHFGRSGIGLIGSGEKDNSFVVHNGTLIDNGP